MANGFAVNFGKKAYKFAKWYVSDLPQDNPNLDSNLKVGRCLKINKHETSISV